LHRNHKAIAVKKIILKSTVIFASLSIMVACNSTNRLRTKNQEKMFTAEQIKEKMVQVKTGADFPVLAINLKQLGVTYYETKIDNGSSIFHGEIGCELFDGTEL
jgi:arabinogalactan endo-1,4-beta-galactosidase